MKIVFFSALLFSVMSSNAQSDDRAEAYTTTITQRAAKIVATLELNDSTTANKVQAVIVQQYRNLNEGKKDKKELHDAYIAKLATLLSPQQVEKIKDGMTYGVLQVTYNAYQDMIPTLTDSQKSKIYIWLVEARELAMDEGSSEEKHKMFGKYKGRINNYLSQQGYDLKKEEKAWQDRLRQKRQQQGQG